MGPLLPAVTLLIYKKICICICIYIYIYTYISFFGLRNVVFGWKLQAWNLFCVFCLFACLLEFWKPLNFITFQDYCFSLNQELICCFQIEENKWNGPFQGILNWVYKHICLYRVEQLFVRIATIVNN